MTEPRPKKPANPPPTYRWPRYVLLAVIVGFLLAVWWVNREVQRTRQLHFPSQESPVAR
jgi:hypothetical protein